MKLVGGGSVISGALINKKCHDNSALTQRNKINCNADVFTRFLRHFFELKIFVYNGEREKNIRISL